MGLLDDKVAIVTGAGRGIGRGIAVELARAGAKVGVVARTQAQLATLVVEIQSIGGHAQAFAIDVTDRTGVEACVARIERDWGRVDFLVNNAGNDRPFGSVGVADPDHWWLALNVQVRGSLLFMHACLPAMQRAGGGRIFNMASAAARIVVPGASAYCVAKCALVRLSEHIDVEQRDHGIRTFTGHPGTLVTDMMRDTLNDHDARQNAPLLFAFLSRYRDADTSNEQARLNAQLVEIAAGLHDDAAGRYIDLEQELRPAGFGPPPTM